MNPRKKLLVSLSTLAVMSVISVLAIIAVFAASNQALQTSVNVQYLAEGVSATVSASYTVGGTTTKMTSSSGYDSITFAPGPNGGSEDGLSPSGDIVIEDTFIVFKYVFNNTSTASSPIYIVLTAPAGFPEGDNMSDYFAYTYGTSVLNLNNNSVGNTGVYEDFEMQVINPGETLNVYVLACVDDDSTDASYSGDFTWMMEELDYATHWNLPEDRLVLSRDSQYYVISDENTSGVSLPKNLILPSEYNGKPVRTVNLNGNTCGANDMISLPYSQDRYNGFNLYKVESLYIPSSVRCILGWNNSSYTDIVFEDATGWVAYTGNVIDTDGDGEGDFCEMQTENVSPNYIDDYVNGEQGIYYTYGVTFAKQQ